MNNLSLCDDECWAVCPPGRVQNLNVGIFLDTNNVIKVKVNLHDGKVRIELLPVYATFNDLDRMRRSQRHRTVETESCM